MVELVEETILQVESEGEKQREENQKNGM